MKTIYHDYIIAIAPIQIWETLFNTTFFNWKKQFSNNEENSELIVRAKEYSLSVEIAPHIEAVFNTVQLPPVMRKKTMLEKVMVSKHIEFALHGHSSPHYAQHN